jgi:hypothetical protein
MKHAVSELVKELYRSCVRAIASAVYDVRRSPLADVFLLVIFALTRAWSLPWDATLCIIIFWAFLLFPWDSKILAGSALAFVIACPLLLSANAGALALQSAIFGFYFLIMTVVVQTMEYLRQKKREHAKN